MVYLGRDDQYTYKLLYGASDGKLPLLFYIDSDSLYDLIDDHQAYATIERWLKPGEVVPVKVTITADWDNKKRIGTEVEVESNE